MTVAEIVGLLGAFCAIIAVIITIITVTGRLARLAGSLEASLSAQNEIIRELKIEVIELRKVVTDNAVLNSRVTALEQQVTIQAKSIDELRHGEGYIIPRNPRRLLGEQP